jgi:hypothetical protein
VKTLLPRLRLSEATYAALRAMAEKRGVGVGDVIAAIVESRLSEASRPDNEILYRLILVGERHGQLVGPTGGFPLDWVNVGRLTPEECREIAASYVAWRRKKDEQAGSLE